MIGPISKGAGVSSDGTPKNSQMTLNRFHHWPQLWWNSSQASVCFQVLRCSLPGSLEDLQAKAVRKILKNNVPKPAWRISHIDEGEGVMRRSPDRREEKIIPKNKTTQTNKHLLHRFEGERLHFTSPCCAAGGTERVHSVERERMDTYIYIYKNPRAQTVDGG